VERKKSKKRLNSWSDWGDSPSSMKDLKHPNRKSLPSERSFHWFEIEENPLPEIEAETSVNYGNWGDDEYEREWDKEEEDAGSRDNYREDHQRGTAI